MSGRIAVVEQSEAVSAPVEHVWPLLSGPAAMALRPDSFAFDVAPTLRMVLSVPGAKPFFVTYEVLEQVPGQVVSLTVPGRPPGTEEVFTLSVVQAGAGSRMTINVRSAVASPAAQAALEDYWQRTLPVWLAGLSDVADGRAPRPDGQMPANLQAACMPPAPGARPATASASAVIAAPAEDVWETVYAPEWAAILLSHGSPVDAGVIPGTPLRQAGEMQYFITHLANGELHNVVTVVKELEAGRFALISPVGTTGLEMLHSVVPDGQGTRLELTFRWPAPAGISNRLTVARSMADTVRQRVQAFKDLIENPASPWASLRPSGRP
jgi:uncharacterized protein YndB with AHSA1/START domain